MSTPAERPPITEVEIDRVQMFTPAPGTEYDRSSLHWGLINFNTGRGFNPRITVWTRVPSDPEKRPIEAPLNHIVAESICAAIEHIVTSCVPEDWGVKFECKLPNKDPETGKRVDGYKLVATVIVGKDKEGMIWMGVVSPNPDRPKIKFVFDSTPINTYVLKDGTPVAKTQISEMVAMATVRTIRNALAAYPPIITDKDRVVQREIRERNNPGRNGGGRSRPAGTTDGFEDITF